MVEWTILSPTFLTAVVNWAGTVVTVFAAGRGQPVTDTEHGEE